MHSYLRRLSARKCPGKRNSPMANSRLVRKRNRKHRHTGQEVLYHYHRCGDSTICKRRKYRPSSTGHPRMAAALLSSPKGNVPQRLHLLQAENASIHGRCSAEKRSDDINNFAIVNTPHRRTSLKYFAALVNADKVNGFISGKGTINGNGHRYWKSFWLRRPGYPEMYQYGRFAPPPGLHLHSNDVANLRTRRLSVLDYTICCNNIKAAESPYFRSCRPVKAPSSDAIDN